MSSENAMKELGGTSLAQYSPPVVCLMLDAAFRAVMHEFISTALHMTDEQIARLSQQQGIPVQRIKDAIRWVTIAAHL